MLKASNSLGIVFFPAFDWAISPTHPEREERLLYTQDQLEEEGLFDIPGITEYKPGVADHRDIDRAHFCVPDVDAVCTDSHFVSAGGAIAAGRLVLEGKKDKAFALVRPPGHHAMKVVHGNRGFCNVNIEAVMLEHLREHFGPLRVAIVDTDCHHGDGTQDIYWNDRNTLFISLHQDGRTLYPGSGFPHENGGINARGLTLNIPLPPGTSDEGFLHVIDHLVLPVLEDFKPDLIINSAGQDNHFSDPITDMRFTARGYALLNQKLNPHIAVLEGGYAVQGALPHVNLAICLAMAGLDFDHVAEPGLNLEKIRQSTEISRHIERLCDSLLEQYHAPGEAPGDGGIKNGLYIRKRDIWYDTDGIREQQVEAVRICGDCSGALKVETQSSINPLCLAVEIPLGACPACRSAGLEWIGQGQSDTRYQLVLANNRMDKTFTRFRP
jgi:acetoin utilization deacetylase AcuC-like enzyme